MLKIKDNIDLKELEKYRFEYYKTVWASDSTQNNEYILVDRFINIDEKIDKLKLSKIIDQEAKMIERLQEYITKDEIYQDYKQDKLMNASDFEKFCIQHCKDIEELINENQELKKQLEKRTKMFQNAYSYSQKMESRAIILETQQKEFIKYLEDEIEQNTPKLRWKHFNEDGLNDYDVENPIYIEKQPTNKVLKEILKKYKSIIGDDE